MYVLKIQNTIKTQDEIFVYEDKNVHFSNLLRSITNDILDTMILTTKQESYENRTSLVTPMNVTGCFNI